MPHRAFPSLHTRPHFAAFPVSGKVTQNIAIKMSPAGHSKNLHRCRALAEHLSAVELIRALPQLAWDIHKLSTVPTVDWVLLGSGDSMKG